MHETRGEQSRQKADAMSGLAKIQTTHLLAPASTDFRAGGTVHKNSVKCWLMNSIYPISCAGEKGSTKATLNASFQMSKAKASRYAVYI